jgi:hypothetical protein
MALKIRLLGPKKQPDVSNTQDTATLAAVTRSDKKNDTDNAAGTENGRKEGGKKRRKKVNPLRAYFEGSTREHYHIYIRSRHSVLMYSSVVVSN